MADGAELAIDGDKLAKEADRLIRGYLTAGTMAVAAATRSLERKLEAATSAAGGGRLAKAWQSSNFPSSGPAQNPVGTIWIKGGSRTRGAITSLTQPGRITGSRGQDVAIPLPAAGPRGRTRDLTPEMWEAQHPGMKLRAVVRPGRATLLVADDAVLSGKGQIARGNTAKRIAAGRGSATVPIFVLLPAVAFRNAFAIQPLVQAAQGEIASEFLSAAGSVT